MKTDQEYEELMERAKAGEDVYQGEWRINHEPFEGSEDVKIGKSLRLPLSIIAAIETIAARRNMSFSSLVREYLAAGLDREEEHEPNPIADLHRQLEGARMALKALEQSRRAA